MNEVLITGSEGFIGNYLSRALGGRWSITGASRKLGDIKDASTWQSFRGVDLVVHLAEKNSVIESWRSPRDYIGGNISSITNALDFCVKQSCGLIYLSSYVYGNAGDDPIEESRKRVANNPYAMSKILCEQLCEFYSEKFQLDITIIRPFNIYGKGQSSSFLIPSLISQYQNRKEVHIEDISPRRDYLYIDDLINLITLCMEDMSGLNVVNAGYGESHSVGDILNFIEILMNVKKRIVINNNIRPNEISNCVANINFAKSRFSWEPKYSLYDGLKKMLGDNCN